MKNKILLLFLSVYFLFSLVSCSSLTAEQCKGMNWQDKGYADAIQGYSHPKIGTYQEQCLKFKISVNEEDYKKGYEKGLPLYCTFESGRYYGKNKSERHLYCERISNDFVLGYKAGLIAKNKELAIERVKSMLENRYGTKTCSFDGDCGVQTSCIQNAGSSSGHCSHNYSECTFDSDCMVRKQCMTLTDFTEYSDSVTVKVCAP